MINRRQHLLLLEGAGIVLGFATGQRSGGHAEPLAVFQSQAHEVERSSHLLEQNDGTAIDEADTPLALSVPDLHKVHLSHSHSKT